ncbi:MAG: helix-turn-helix transcriptional regulator [Acidobacteriota bacterium]
MTPTDRLLDMPYDTVNQPLEFLTRIHSLNEMIASRLLKLKDSLTSEWQDQQSQLEEQLHSVLDGLLLLHRISQREIEQISAVRQTTRLELYRRLYRARDYAAATLNEPITLNEMAGIACLSPNHFLRSFRQLFRQTPHQYLTSLRLERAKELLLKTNLAVTEICFEVGFESLGSFSTLFRHHLGVSPQTYRQVKGLLRRKR